MAATRPWRWWRQFLVNVFHSGGYFRKVNDINVGLVNGFDFGYLGVGANGLSAQYTSNFHLIPRNDTIYQCIVTKGNHRGWCLSRRDFIGCFLQSYQLLVREYRTIVLQLIRSLRLTGRTTVRFGDSSPIDGDGHGVAAHGTGKVCHFQIRDDRGTPDNHSFATDECIHTNRIQRSQVGHHL